MALGRRKLPWNPGKSWAGTLAYFVFGTAGAWALLLWTAPGRYTGTSLVFTFAACAVTALVGGLLESLPQGLDDNIGVPLVCGLLLLGLLLTEGGWGTRRRAGVPARRRRSAWRSTWCSPSSPSGPAR